MRPFHLVALALLALPAVACSSSEGAASGDDQNATSGKPKGALVKVSISSTVGVRIDDAPAPGDLEKAFVGRDDTKQSFWLERAKLQLKHTLQRQYFRGTYYDGGLTDDPEVNKDPKVLLHPTKGQLPMPPDVDESGKDLWGPNITLKSAAKVVTQDGHRFIVRDYSYTGYLLTDEASPGNTEPMLKSVGGIWNEPHILPLDPENILQRTGYACMTENEFPPNSVDSVNAWRFFDYTCKPDLASGCHPNPAHPELGGRPLPADSCQDAMKKNTGSASTNLVFERMDIAAKGADFLAKVRVGDPGGKDGADMGVRKDDLEDNRVVWRFVGESSCEMKEENGIVPGSGCVTGSGWRRVLEFSATGHNVGTKPIHIGPVNYLIQSDVKTQNDKHGIFEYSACHNHFHFAHYGNFKLNGGSTSNRKNGFCLESTTRFSNNEWSPIETQYGRCVLQGVEVGWGDEYEAGITCQWIDVTNVQAGKVDLAFQSNPEKFLCEGSLVGADGKATFNNPDKNGNPTAISEINEATGWQDEVGADGKPLLFTPRDLTGKVTGPAQHVQGPRCQPIKGAYDNNEEKTSVELKPFGGLVAGACKGEQFGPLRDCGLQHETPQAPTAARTCTPGAEVHVTCRTKAQAAQVVRLCEASRDPKVGGAIDCMHIDALRLNPGQPSQSDPRSATVTADKPVDLTFTCPAAREGVEQGGRYSVYTGAFTAGDAPQGVTCDQL